MKKGFWILTLAIVMLLGACGQGTTESQADEKTAASGLELKAGQFTANDLVFVYNDEQYPLDTDASRLIKALGSDYETTTAVSCVYKGDDKKFDYENGWICTYPMDGKDMIDEIYFFGGDFETTKGIAIGNTVDDVIAQYGQGEQTETAVEYTLVDDGNKLDNPQLTFELTDGKVSGISYYSASNRAE